MPTRRLRARMGTTKFKKAAEMLTYVSGDGHHMGVVTGGPSVPGTDFRRKGHEYLASLR